MGKERETRIDYLRGETDLFTEPGYDVTIQSTTNVEYHPLNSVTDRTAPISFFIQGNDVQYLDFAESKLYLRCKIQKENGDALTAVVDPAVITYAPINNFLHSIFDKVTVHLNEVEITSKGSHYPYRAYIESFLGYSRGYKKSIGEAAMLTKTDSETSTTDPGWVKRKDKVESSKEFEVAGKLHTELFTQPRFLIPGIDVRIQLHRASDAFCLQCVGSGAQNLKLVILEARLFVKKHTLLPSIQLAHLKNLEHGNPVVYPNRSIEVKSYTLPTDALQSTNENLITGHLPDRIVIGMVDSAAVHGSIKTNPLAFEHFDLSNINVKVNGENVTEHAVDLDVAGNRSVLAYLSLFENLGLTNCDSGVDIKLDEFKNGKVLHVFNLRQVRDTFCLPKFGNVAISLRFKVALPKSITILVYAEYESVMHINREKQIYFKDYTK